MTIEAKEYFLFLRVVPHENEEQRAVRRSEGLPDESDTVVFTNPTREGIIATVNEVFQKGVTESFPLLPSLLAPFSYELYAYEITRATFNTRALLIWRRLTPSQRRRRNAQFQVAFYVPSSPPYAAVSLAYFLLFFTYTAIRSYVTKHYDYDVRRQPRLKGLAYHLRLSGAYGVALFDDIDDVFNTANDERLWYPVYRSGGLSGDTLSTWPPYEASLLREEEVV